MDQKMKYARAARWAVLGLGVAVAAPLVTMLVKGLVGLIIAGVLGLAAITFAPLIGNQFAVWKIKGIKAMARANPVETLQTVYAEKKKALSEFLIRIQTFSADVANFSDKVAQFQISYPADAATFVQHLNKMVQLLDLRKAEYAKAQSALAAFDGEIDKADSIWKMGQAAAAVSKSAGFDSDELYAKIKSETAIEQVQLSLNRAFAQLDTALLEQESDQRLKLSPATPAMLGITESEKVV